MLVKLMLALLVGCPGPVDGEGAVGGVVGEPSPVDVEPPVDPAEPGSSDDAAQPAQVSDADLEALVRGNNAFAFDLYRAAASGYFTLCEQGLPRPVTSPGSDTGKPSE